MNLQHLTIKAQETVNQAQNVVLANGQQSIENAHLLAAIIKEDAEMMQFITGKLSVNLNRLQQAIEGQLKGYAKVEGGTVYASQEFSLAIVHAEKAMKEMGDEFVTNEHLLLGIFDTKGVTSTILKDAGFKRDDLKKAIQMLRGGKKSRQSNRRKSI